jgi:hypothetical protein
LNGNLFIFRFIGQKITTCVSSNHARGKRFEIELNLRSTYEKKSLSPLEFGWRVFQQFSRSKKANMLPTSKKRETL